MESASHRLYIPALKRRGFPAILIIDRKVTDKMYRQICLKVSQFANLLEYKLSRKGKYKKGQVNFYSPVYVPLILMLAEQYQAQ